MSGYTMTSPMEAAPSTILYRLSEVSTASPAVSCKPRKTSACCFVTVPAARGRVLVRSTLLSMSISHISLIVHPAPRITKAPIPNLVIIHRSGKAPMGATIAMLQQHGQRSNHVPIGLSSRASSAYGLSGTGIRFIKAFCARRALFGVVFTVLVVTVSIGRLHKTRGVSKRGAALRTLAMGRTEGDCEHNCIVFGRATSRVVYAFR
mmetsp:Transcript_6878/g.13607  ORF Transcript_6878/g.13607 Transcript_6878/m.13607 type:complete len:206 (-) Transcript_6878:89-706(-)